MMNRYRYRFFQNTVNFIVMVGMFVVMVLSVSADIVQKDYFEIRGGLKNSQKVFTSTKKGRVAFLGGSISTMSWRGRVCEYIKRLFPETEFEFINAAIPSMGSTPGAFRLKRDVLSSGKIDLLFQEAAVNDLYNGRTDNEQIRAMEGIVRQVRNVNPEADILFLYFADPEKVASYNKGVVPAVIRNHEKVAKYYSLPSVNLALEVTERINRKEFTWKDDFKDLHPSEFGQKLYSESISRFLDSAWCDSIGNEDKIVIHVLPPKLNEFSYDRANLIDIKNAVDANGFKYVSKWCNSDDCATRAGFVDVPMLVGENPGDSFSFNFNGTAAGIFVVAGRDAGIIEYSFDCSDWQKLDLFTKWSKSVHLPWLYILNAQLKDQPHILKIRVSKEKNTLSEGHACRIVYFGVNGQ